MKLTVLDIKPVAPNQTLVELSVGGELVESEIVEENCRGLNFSNMLVGYILLYSDLLRTFCTNYFEYREGNHTPPPWTFDIDDVVLAQAKQMNSRVQPKKRT